MGTTNNGVIHLVSGLFQQKLLRTGLYTAFLKICSQLVVLASGIVVARYLGPENYGIYAFAMALIGVFILISQLGFTTYSVKQISTYEASGNWQRLRSYIIFAFLFVLCGSTVVALLCYLYFSTYSNQLNDQVVFAAVLLIPVSALFRVLQSFMNGFQFIRQSETIALIRQTVFIALCGSVVLISLNSFNPVSVLYIQGVSTAFSVLLFIWYIQSHAPKELRATKGYDHSNAWLSGAFSFVMLSMMNYINTQTDTLMIGIFRESSEVAFYRVASQAAMLVGFATQIVMLLIAPKIAKLYATNQMSVLQRLITNSTQIIFVFALTMTAILLVFASNIIQILFGAAYLDASQPLFVLCLGKLMVSMIACAAIVLNMCGYEKSTTKILVISASLNVVFNYILVPEYGAYGAAIATAVVVTLSSFLMYMKVKQVLGLNTSIFSKFQV